MRKSAKVSDKSEKKQLTDKKHFIEIKGILILLLAIFSFAACCGAPLGRVGNSISLVLSYISGRASFLIPTVLAVTGFFLMIAHRNILKSLRFFIFTVLCLCFLGLVQLFCFPDVVFIDTPETFTQGGGLAGYALYFFLHKITGSFGAALLLFSGLIICLLMFFNFSVRAAFLRLKNRFAEYLAERKKASQEKMDAEVYEEVRKEAEKAERVERSKRTEKTNRAKEIRRTDRAATMKEKTREDRYPLTSSFSGDLNKTGLDKTFGNKDRNKDRNTVKKDRQSFSSAGIKPMDTYNSSEFSHFNKGIKNENAFEKIMRFGNKIMQGDPFFAKDAGKEPENNTFKKEERFSTFGEYCDNKYGKIGSNTVSPKEESTAPQKDIFADKENLFKIHQVVPAYKVLRSLKESGLTGNAASDTVYRTEVNEASSVNRAVAAENAETVTEAAVAIKTPEAAKKTVVTEASEAVTRRVAIEAMEDLVQPATQTFGQNQMQNNVEAPLQNVTKTSEENSLQSAAETSKQNPVQDAAEISERNSVQDVAGTSEQNPVQNAAETFEENPLQEVTEASKQNSAQDAMKNAEEAGEEKNKENNAENTEENNDENNEEDGPESDYIFPPIELLHKPVMRNANDYRDEIRNNCAILEQTLADFKVKAEVIAVTRGPSVTRFELEPAPGIKVSSVVNLADDIALRLAASGVRIEAPIPGKAAIGIEVPNKTNDSINLREVVDCKEIQETESPLCIGLGRDISGNVISIDLSKMPHLLVAGSTGSGKSVCINSLITGIMYKATPEEVKLILVDPKVVELSNYNGIPHLLVPVVTDAKKAASALYWAVQEMERRYQAFADNRVREITGYNKTAVTKMPYIVIVIDEMSDLMMVAKADVEDAILRLAQKARAAGIHLVLATQRPSVDVITGIVKANIPSRIAFAVSSQTDSRTILDMGGAEKLLGKGDMLFYPVGVSKPLRVQGAFVSDEELNAVTDFIKKQAIPVEYSEEVTSQKLPGEAVPGVDPNNLTDVQDKDEYFDEALKLVLDMEQASSSMLQRRFRIGYTRAARIVDCMEDLGIVGPPDGSKPRELLMDRQQVEAEFLHK